MIERFPGFQPPIAQLFGLADGPFDAPHFRRKCERFATFDAGSSFDDIWRFSLDSGVMLIVALNTEPTGMTLRSGWPELQQLAVSCAILSICWWETFLNSEHESQLGWQTERDEFDQCYSEALARIRTILGPPQIEGLDATEDQHRYAIWRGRSGLLILQQSCYDPQFGLDVNYWVQPWIGPDPRPTSPFIDWLCQLSSGSKPPGMNG